MRSIATIARAPATLALALGLATIALALLALAGAGCGGDATTTKEPEQPQAGPLVAYSRSGGVAGAQEQLRIERDGEATVSEYGGEPHPFQLGDGELALLESELAAADFEAIETDPGPTVCADCYVYAVTYEGHPYSYDDLVQPPQSVLTAVDHLTRLATENYPPATDPASPGG
jgi:hypothetical protein